jgi:predicted peroxiredoxin
MICGGFKSMYRVAKTANPCHVANFFAKKNFKRQILYSVDAHKLFKKKKKKKEVNNR